MSEIKTKPPTKSYDEGWDRIFKKPPSCLDSAYEREAMKKGLVDKPVFEENKIGRQRVRSGK